MARMIILCVHLMILFFLIVGADGYDYCLTRECVFSSFDLSDEEYIETYHYNKEPFMRYNSTVGKFVGFNQLGVKGAEKYNKDYDYLAIMKTQLEHYCKHNAPIYIRNILTKTVEPKVKMMSEQKANGPHPAILMCSAYDFYPKQISVSWLRDGKPVTTDVISTDEMADGDWYYQVHTHLEYTPKSGEKISCVVEHASFKTPMIYEWDPSLPESEKNKIAIGASGLVLGIILSAAGFIYYKKKSSGRILVPS